MPLYSLYTVHIKYCIPFNQNLELTLFCINKFIPSASTQFKIQSGCPHFTFMILLSSALIYIKESLLKENVNLLN